MNPKIGDAKVDALLTQFLLGYRNENYIAELIMPSVTVIEKTGKYGSMGKDNLRFYGKQIARAPGTRAVQVNYSVSQGSYACQENSMEIPVPDEAVVNTDKPFDARRDATRTLIDLQQVNREKALADVLDDTSVVTNYENLSGTDRFDDYDNSDPLQALGDYITTFKTTAFGLANSLIMNDEVAAVLASHPVIREQLKYTGNGNFGVPALAAFLKQHFRGIRNVFIGDAVYNSADEGDADVCADIWAKNVWIGYTPDRPGIFQRAFGYTIRDKGNYVDGYRDEPIKSDIIRIQESIDQHIVDATQIFKVGTVIS